MRHYRAAIRKANKSKLPTSVMTCSSRERRSRVLGCFGGFERCSPARARRSTRNTVRVRGPWWPLWGSSWGVLFTMHSCATPCTATHYHLFIWGVGIGFTIILLFCMYAQPLNEGAKYLMKDQSLFSAYFKWQYDASPTAAPNTSNIGRIGQCNNVFFI